MAAPRRCLYAHSAVAPVGALPQAGRRGGSAATSARAERGARRDRAQCMRASGSSTNPIAGLEKRRQHTARIRSGSGGSVASAFDKVLNENSRTTVWVGGRTATATASTSMPRAHSGLEFLAHAVGGTAIRAPSVPASAIDQAGEMRKCVAARKRSIFWLWAKGVAQSSKPGTQPG